MQTKGTTLRESSDTRAAYMTHMVDDDSGFTLMNGFSLLFRAKTWQIDGPQGTVDRKSLSNTMIFAGHCCNLKSTDTVIFYSCKLVLRN